MNIKRFVLAITILIVIAATVLAIAPAHAATVCSPATAITVPYAKDGVGDVCLKATSLCGYINSWNLTTLDVNGTSYLNAYVAGSAIAPLNGGYTIHYVSTVSWGHFEIGGTCTTGPTATTGPSLTPTRTNTSVGPTATKTNTPVAPKTNTPTPTPDQNPSRTLTPTIGIPSLTPTRTPTSNGSCTGIAGPYAKDGIDDVCLQATSLCGYINSWNLTTLDVNGTSYLNTYVAGSAIAPVNGAYTIHYVSTVSYGHFEIGGTCTTGPTATNTPTVGIPSLTPTPTKTNTPTIGIPSPTPTRTPTSGGPTVTPTRTGITQQPPTATRTATPGSGTCSPVTSTITAPFTYDGAGTFCWQSSNLGSYINSWNLTTLSINGTNETNLYVAVGSYPAKINGYWYVSYVSTVAWGHFEAK